MGLFAWLRLHQQRDQVCRQHWAFGCNQNVDRI